MDHREGGPGARAMASAIRRWVIEQSLESQVGHIGSALSIVEIVAALWGGVMRRPGTAEPDRDRFILSKGHAVLALYGALRWCGLMDEAVFHTYCGDGTALGAHPEHALPGIDVSTGSLGQGLSVGCGLAYGLRHRGLPCRVWVLLSDAECNEGQVWEAAMFAAHHRLANLTAVVDLNGLQATGRTAEVLDTSPLAERWLAFGWEAAEVDGHDVEVLQGALSAPAGGRPRVLVARTTLGKGVPFMEDRLEWHYRNLTPELAEQALGALGGSA
jgi:transketolase